MAAGMRDAPNTVGIGGIVTDRSRTLRTRAQGVRRRGSGAAVTESDLWHIGSNAKAMTAALYARLVEEGIACWGATVDQLFPGISIHESWRGVTVEQLMSHSGGLSDRGLADIWALIKSELDERPLPQQRLSLAAKAFAAPPAGRRGCFEYANANYIVVGSAIEQRLATTWEAAIRERLFEPLAMASAGFGAPVGEQPWGHRWRLPSFGRLKPVSPGRSADNPPFLWPAGGVHLSLDDYAKFLRLFLGAESEVLSPSSIEKLAAPLSASPEYSLGWLVEDMPWAGGRALVHQGSNTMWFAAAIVAPERGLAAAAAANEGTEAAGRATLALARRLIEDFS